MFPSYRPDMGALWVSVADAAILQCLPLLSQTPLPALVQDQGQQHKNSKFSITYSFVLLVNTFSPILGRKVFQHSDVIES